MSAYPPTVRAMPKPLDDSPVARERRAALGMRLRLLRTRRGWSQERLAVRAGGLDRSFYAEIEAGRASPGVDYLWALADALELGIGDLFRDEWPEGWPPDSSSPSARGR